MLTNPQITVAVVVVAVITFVCRIVPFVLLRGRRTARYWPSCPGRCRWGS